MIEPPPLHLHRRRAVVVDEDRHPARLEDIPAWWLTLVLVLSLAVIAVLTRVASATVLAPSPTPGAARMRACNSGGIVK